MGRFARRLKSGDEREETSTLTGYFSSNCWYHFRIFLLLLLLLLLLFLLLLLLLLLLRLLLLFLLYFLFSFSVHILVTIFSLRTLP